MPDVRKKPSIMWPLAAIGGAFGLALLASKSSYAEDYMPKIPRGSGPDDDLDDELAAPVERELSGVILTKDDVQRSRKIDCGGAPCLIWFERPKGNEYTSRKLSGGAGGSQTEIAHIGKKTYVGWKFWRAGTAVIQIRQNGIYSSHYLLDLRNVGRTSGGPKVT